MSIPPSPNEGSEIEIYFRFVNNDFKVLIFPSLLNIKLVNETAQKTFEQNRHLLDALNPVQAGNILQIDSKLAGLNPNRTMDLLRTIFGKDSVNRALMKYQGQILSAFVF